VLKTLIPGAIGLKDLPLPEAVALAARFGFPGLHVDLRQCAAFAADHGEAALLDLFAANGVQAASCALPVNWRSDEALPNDLAALPALAALADRLQCRAAATFIMPGSDERAFDDNVTWHTERIRPAATILADHNIRLGLEFCGPESFRRPFAFPFLWTAAAAMDMARAIGLPNVGLLLDAWHVHAGGEDVTNLGDLTANDIVIVHVSDAPAGVPLADLQDLKREEPLATGEIDLRAFVQALKHMGYAGPISSEPLGSDLDALAATDPDEALRRTSRVLDDLLAAG
jgi:sugar phosphate isomerase/epimerase